MILIFIGPAISMQKYRAKAATIIDPRDVEIIFPLKKEKEKEWNYGGNWTLIGPNLWSFTFVPLFF